MPTAITDTVSALDQLPPFPPVALRMLEALTREEVDTGELVRLVSADPVLASEILHAANSPLFGLPRRVKTLRHAIVLVGRNHLRPLLFTAALRAYVRAPGRSRLFREWWRHSLAAALLADGLAAASRMAQGEAYTAALLHDIGRLGLMMAAGADRYRSLIARQPATPAVELEREELGIDHCAAGKILIEKWELPRDLAEASARHHDGFQRYGLPLTNLVALACSLATALGFWTHKPPQPASFADWRASVPPGLEWTERLREEQLRESLERRIGSYGLP